MVGSGKGLGGEKIRLLKIDATPIAVLLISAKGEHFQAS
jgi:hypothetical protein